MCEATREKKNLDEGRDENEGMDESFRGAHVCRDR